MQHEVFGKRETVNIGLIVILIAYVIFSVGGATLVKLSAATEPLFTVPVVNVGVSVVTVLGMVGYGISFILYIIMLTKFDLSFLTPVTTAIVYTLLMVASILVFHESFTLVKAIGCILVLAGVIVILSGR